MTMISPAPPRTPPTVAIIACFTTVYIVWGTTYLATRIAVEAIPPFLMRGISCATAGAILCLAAGRRTPRPSPAEWLTATLVGLLMFVGCQGVQAAVQRYVASGLVALVAASISLWIPLVAWAAPGGKSPGRRALIGAGLGVSGVGFLVAERPNGGFGHLSLGMAIILLLSTFSWAVGTELSRQLRRPASPWLASGMTLLTAGVLLLFLGLALGEGRAMSADIPLRAWLAVAYHVGANYLLCFSCYIWLLAVARPENVATYAYVNPLVAVTLGWLVAGETVTLHTVMGATLIVAAVAITVNRRAV